MSLRNLTDAIEIIDEAFKTEGYAAKHPELVGSIFVGWELRALTNAVFNLGNADEATPMGAVEGLGVALKEAANDIVDAILRSGGA